jgi:hypothetical protein
MVKARNPRDSDDATSVRQFDSPRDRRVSVERHVRAVLVVVSSVRSNQSQQVALAQDDDMVEYLTPERTDEPLRVSFLPGRPGRGFELADAETTHTPIERGAVDPVAISYQSSDPGVEADGLDDLLRGPGLMGVARDVHVQEPPPFERKHEEYDSNLKVAVGTTTKSMSIVPDRGRGRRPAKS